jgi:predicted outer membrane repeat protein
MNKFFILLLLLNQCCQAESLWGLNSETEMRLSQALDLVYKESVNKQNKAGISFVTVGDDGACDFRVGSNKIQNAIDSNASEIRIASNATYEENIVIDNPSNSITLRGGFADCGQAQLNNQSSLIDDRTSVTRLNGQTNSVFSIRNALDSRVITFENLKIIGGNSQSLGSGGAVSLSETESDVIFNNVWLTGTNKSFTGGGLSVVSSNSTVILNNSDIFNNITAGSGGGIYCNNFTAQLKRASIVLAQDSNLYANFSDQSGGGASIGKDCLFTSFSGSATVNGEKGIYGNSAVNHGGAIEVSSGANVLIYGHLLCNFEGRCFGNNTDPASVYDNQANIIGNNRNGGAISATGNGTDVTIVAGHVYDNHIDFNLTDFGAGGAISLTTQASLNIQHPNQDSASLPCWNTDRCNLFNNNTAATGGVIFTNDAEVNISHAYFEDNRANSGMGFYFSGNEVITIENSILNNNGDNGNGTYDDDNLIQATGSSSINLAYTTIADNDSDQVVFDIGSTASLDLQSSIIHDPDSGNVVNSTLGTIASNCVMAHETSSFAGTNKALDDPEFIDRLNRDYHLDPDSSPAIDFCDQYSTSLNKDIDFQERGFDNLSLSNFIGPFDIGADESYIKTFATVGGDVNCDFNTSNSNIQEAIDTRIGEIRIAANGTHNQTISVGNFNIKLRGGYADCSAAENDIQTTQTNLIVTQGSLEPVISISGISQRNNIELENFNMTSELGASAVTVINANADISLNNIMIQNNNLNPGFFGGGVFIAESFVDFNMIDTIISENSAPQAGGLYCRGTGAKITMSGNSGLALNTTTGKGGGAYITQGCRFTMYSGIANPTALSTIGISANIADEEGGGIYTDLGGKVILNGHKDCTQQCIGDDINPVSVNHNKSNSGISGGERGGGIYMTGLETTVDIYAALFSENQSPNGGAIYVNDQAVLNVSRLTEDCWDRIKCNYFFKNRALGAGTGGAIQNDQGSINISSSYFEENDGRTGSVLYAFGSNSQNRIEGSVFNHNSNQGTGDKYVIRAAVSASIDISHSTFADNFIANSTLFGISSDSELTLNSSIVHETEGDVFDINQGTLSIFCLMAHETTSFTGTLVLLDDPLFVDRANRDYHLDINNSPAIDICDDNLSEIQFNDIDFQMRGIDNPAITNVNGTFDLGADEATVIDLIFENGFE